MSRSGRGHVRGPLACYAEGFREDLLGQGYTQGSAAHQIHLMAHVSRWLEASGLEPADLDDSVTRQFVAARRAGGYAALRSARALAPLLGYLRGLGVAAAPRMPEPQVSGDRLAGRFAEYLARERGLAVDSVRSYTGVARRFLAEVAIGDGCRVEGLTAADVTGFVRRECGRRGVASAKATVTGLRALLRFLYLDGQITVPLAGAVPSAACWQLAALPRAVSAADLAQIMDSCDRRSVAGQPGQRDTSAAGTPGLAGWRGRRAGAGRHQLAAGRDRHPRQGQPPRHTAAARRRRRGGGRLAGRGPPARSHLPGGVRAAARSASARLASTSVSYVVRRACVRAGIAAAGAHRLRHAAAVSMLAAGGTLAEIGQVLRHARPGTTAIYAKADVLALSPLARPWPGSPR